LTDSDIASNALLENGQSEDKLDSLLFISVAFLESLNAAVEVFDPNFLSHLNGSAEELFLGDLDTLVV
jgi:hypothetical protein